MNGEDDDPLGSCWALITGRETRPAYEDEVLGAMRGVTDLCEKLVHHGDPSPQLQAALSLVHQAATVAGRVGRQEEPSDLVARISAARLALLGFAVPHRDEGLIIRMRDRQAAIFREVRHAASNPADEGRRNAQAAAVADRVMMIAGCEAPPDPALIRSAIGVRPEPRPEDDELVAVMNAVGLPPTTAESLGKGIRRALPHIPGIPVDLSDSQGT